MRLLARLFGRHVRGQVEDFVAAVGKVVGIYLMKQYEGKYKSEREAALLASAVANELFGAPPGNEIGRQFLASNKELVETHLRELKNEPRICEIVSVAAHTRMNVAGNSGSITPEMVLWTVKLRDFGILLPIEKVRTPSSPDEMKQQVREFEVWALDLK